MSTEENANETVAEETVKGTAAEETTKQTINTAKNSLGNIISAAMALKESNPKVFFGAVGGVVLLLVIMMNMGGDGSKSVTGPAIKSLNVGQQYVLKSANAYDPAATVRLASVPGALEAYDDTELADRTGACQHMPQGTPVKVIGLQDAYGKKNAYVNVEFIEGECQGTKAWAFGIDVQ
jgi:hypothetical protein